MRRCLIVDDSRVVRSVARRFIEPLGFAVDEVGDGQMAVAACEQQMPDVVLLDWNMPVMTGIEFLRHLRARDDGDKPIVIMCTTEKDVNHIQEAITAGANEYLVKPFDQDTLTAKFGKVGLG
ncbi:response regulator [Bradyrhizobium sp. dw_78]|uniref:response regulator n=1 Tax=Bradyrhizobium sp. dw_78 TaxID=2719793 RepID=UPI001BD5C40E|nr:response regulator [Bradyrhizobium sp. dw_78]